MPFKEKAIVRHKLRPDWGAGRVLMRNDEYLQIDFTVGGLKKLKTSIADDHLEAATDEEIKALKPPKVKAVRAAAAVGDKKLAVAAAVEPKAGLAAAVGKAKAGLATAAVKAKAGLATAAVKAKAGLATATAGKTKPAAKASPKKAASKR